MDQSCASYTWGGTEKHRQILEDEFHVFSGSTLFCSWYTILATDSRNAWRLLGANIG